MPTLTKADEARWRNGWVAFKHATCINGYPRWVVDLWPDIFPDHPHDRGFVAPDWRPDR